MCYLEKMSITRDDIMKTAKLSKLSFEPQDADRFAGEMSKIITFVEKLNELDLKNVEATSHAVAVSNVFRPDETRNAGIIEKALEQAPGHDGTLFQVPKVL